MHLSSTSRIESARELRSVTSFLKINALIQSRMLQAEGSRCLHMRRLISGLAKATVMKDGKGTEFSDPLNALTARHRFFRQR